jgi:hypothetical protein
VNDAQKVQLAYAHLRRMAVPWKKWEQNVKDGKYPNPGATEGGKAKALLDQIGAGGGSSTGTPTSPAAPSTIPAAFRGRGMLATWNTESVFRDLAPYLDWIALLGRLPDTTMQLADEIRRRGCG